MAVKIVIVILICYSRSSNMVASMLFHSSQMPGGNCTPVGTLLEELDIDVSKHSLQVASRGRQFISKGFGSAVKSKQELAGINLGDCQFQLGSHSNNRMEADRNNVEH